MKIAQKGYCLSLISILFALPFISYAEATPSHQFSIDRLYPENWYTKAREHCLLVWSTLEDMIEQKNSKLPLSYALDVTVGQLTFAKRCVHHLITTKHALEHDAVIHLSRIVATIQERCGQLTHAMHRDKIDLLQHIVEKLRKKVTVLLAIFDQL